MDYNKLKTYITNLFNKDKRFLTFAKINHFYPDMPDDEYLIKKWKALMGTELNLDDPHTFNEKLQWLKLYDRKPEYTTMVDKYAVKKYIADKIGEQYIIPTLGVWDKFDDIDFNKLPNQFVLKCTHDSGGLVICRDKSKFDVDAARKKINKSLKRNYYYSGREWPYKNVPPRIIAEQYMEDTQSSYLRDYKFFCFDGKVKFLYLSEGLENHETARISYVSLDWKPMPFARDDYKPFEKLPPKPDNLEEMIRIAEELSQGVPHVRVDFYDVNGQILFGELTFYSGSGYTKFNPESFDFEIGKLLNIPYSSKKRFVHNVQTGG